MKIVFLDIDGPIQNMRSALAGFKYDPATVVTVNEFLAHEDVRVVLSSTVRILCDDALDAKGFLEREYALQGFQFHEHWCTGQNYGGGKRNREREIREWLVKHQCIYDNYYAIDDDPINIENVIQFKADYNGLPYIELLRIRGVHHPDAARTAKEWIEWEEKKNANEDRNRS
jgi:hypothetical protein